MFHGDCQHGTREEMDCDKASRCSGKQGKSTIEQWTCSYYDKDYRKYDEHAVRAKLCGFDLFQSRYAGVAGIAFVNQGIPKSLK